MGVVEHAEAELRRAGYLDADSDYGPELAECVLATLRTFYSYGHSGGSMASALDLFVHLAAYGTLGPVTSDPDEWSDMSDMSGTPLWQNRRKPDTFSEDGGKTWYSLDERAAQKRATEAERLASIDPIELGRATLALWESRSPTPGGDLVAPECLWNDLGNLLVAAGVTE